MCTYISKQALDQTSQLDCVFHEMFFPDINFFLFCHFRYNIFQKYFEDGAL